jgi:hypothetical protein
MASANSKTMSAGKPERPNGDKAHFSSLVARALIVGLILFVAAGGATAQSELATLTGTVTDESGAVMVGANVKLTDLATNISQEVLTNDSGRYSVTSLKPGAYSVAVAHPGFKMYLNSGVTLQVNQTARLDITMSLGAVTEQVNVTAEAPLLQTETSDRGEVIDERKIVELPLNGRDYNQLATLAPGVLLPSPRLRSIDFKGAFNVNGNRAFQNAFRLDGVDNTSYSNSYRGGNMQVIQPQIDALQEFKVQTNAYQAEFGRSAGALINAVIKSGANGIHGSAFEFFRNDDLDASNFFSNKSGSDKPFRLRNQFGGTIGGPIVKNKTFFFGDYEGLRDDAGTVRFTSVPQSAWSEGRFTIPIYNPLNPNDRGQDFLRPATPDCNDGNGNCWIIPQSMMDPVGLNILGVSPDPNTGALGQIDNNFVGTPVTSNRTDRFDVRVDHLLPHNINLFGRYSLSDTTIFKPAPRPGLAEGSFNDTFGSAEWRSQAFAIGATYAITPTLITEGRFGYTRGNFFQLPPNFGSGCPGELIGLEGAPRDPSICGGIPVIDFPGGRGRRIGRTTSVPQFQTPRSYDIRDSVTWINGSHAFKFGGELLHVQTGIRDVSALLGRFNFTGRFTGQNGEWQGAIADLLLGFPTRYRQDSNTVFNLWQKIYSVYAQDDWKLTPKLTLNYGLRWEFATPPRDRNLFTSNLDPNINQFISAEHGSLFKESLIRPDYTDFAPRFGFAYKAFKNVVFRGAYGIFYNHTNRQGREGLLGFNPPFIVLGNANISGSGTLKADDALFRLQDGIPAGFVDISKVDLTGVSRKAQPIDQRSSYTQQYNFNVQWEFARNWLFDVGYIGNLGRKLAAFRNLNQRAVSFDPTTGAPVVGARPLADSGLNGNIQFLENGGVSNYNSLQAKLEKRFSNGLSALVSYTYGKALTDAVDHLATSGAGNGVDVGVFREPQNGFDRASEYGLAEFDVAHRLVASAVWEVPYGRGRHFGSGSSRPLDLILGGWELSPIITAQTGLGLTVNQPGLLNLGGERRSRPNRIGDGELPSSQRTVDRYFDTSAFVILQTDPSRPGFVPNQAFGNSGIGVIRGPKLINVDFNLAKNFDITERHKLQFRAEFFNAFNRANFGVPGVTASAGFGQITNTATDARIIQFALKYRF